MTGTPDRITDFRPRWKRRLSALLVSSSLTLGLVACGSDSTSEGTPTASSEGTPTASSEGTPTASSEGTPTASSEGPLDVLADVAATEDGILWYESLPPEVADEVIAAFNLRYPEVDVDYQQMVGGDVASRIVQESAAGVRTADVANSSVAQAAELNNRGLLLELDFDKMGVEKPELIGSSYAGVPSYSHLAVFYNTNIVEDSEAPSTWDDLLDPKWRDLVGTWVRGNYFSQMESEWGREATEEYIARFMDQNPRVFDSTAAMAQVLATGELALGMGVYHSALPAIEAGAPIKAIQLDPVFVASNWTFVTKASNSPNSAMLFLGWLLSDEGNIAYEAVTGRGSGYLDTNTARLFEGRTLAEWDYPDDLERDADAIARYSLILERGGTPG